MKIMRAKDKFVFGYDSRTGLKGINEGIEKITKQSDEELVIEIEPHNIIPSIEHTIIDFESFKEYIEEQAKSFKCKIIYSKKWDKYKKEPMEKKVEKKENKKSTSNILKEQLLKVKPVKRKESPKKEEEKNSFKELDSKVRCGFTVEIKEETQVKVQVNKSGTLKIKNTVAIISENNLGTIEAQNSTLILKTGMKKGVVFFNDVNISEKLELEKSYVIFKKNNEIIIEIL